MARKPKPLATWILAENTVSSGVVATMVKHKLRSNRDLWMQQMVCVGLVLIGACGGLTEEEKDFYRRASTVEVGWSVEQVQRLLNAPSRIIDAEPVCNQPAGKKEWIYDSFASNGVEKKLRDRAIIFCVGPKGTVDQILDVVQ